MTGIQPAADQFLAGILRGEPGARERMYRLVVAAVRNSGLLSR
jgi:hypothetical protein